jgi:hypothetical protein
MLESMGFRMKIHLFRYIRQLCTPRFGYSSVAEGNAEGGAEGEAEAKPKAAATVLDVLDRWYQHLVLQHTTASSDATATPRP